MEKKLTRDVENKKLAGVCAGIAKYFDLDPTIVRILWIIFTCLGGAGILAYLICWLVMPEDKGTEEPKKIVNE